MANPNPTNIKVRLLPLAIGFMRTLKMLDSMAMLEDLGDNPSSRDLDSVMSLRVEEYIAEEISSSNYELWNSILPQYRKTELCFGKHLGKGVFLDVFEVSVVVVNNDRSFNKVKDDLKDNDRVDSLTQFQVVVERALLMMMI